MTEYIIICLVALIGSGLTLFSGFGLGTLLTPVFVIFFPIDMAITLTAIVHFLNNVFKLVLVGKHADFKIIIRFGLPSIAFALLGAWLLQFITGLPVVYTYQLSGSTHSITVVKLVIGIILLLFSLFDLIPFLANMQFDKKYMPLGGILSGFFGGLSGNQGALRSAFLIRAGLSKEAYIATGVVIACLIDISRLSVYSNRIMAVGNELNYGLLIAATLSAFIGAYAGNKLIKKITIKSLQIFVAVMLFIFSGLLMAGVI